MSIFNSLFGSGREEGNAVFFGLQVVVGFDGANDPRAEIYKIVSEYVGKDSMADRRIFYNRVNEQLLKLSADIAYVFWDYITDPEAASNEYEQWTGEIADTSLVEADQRLDEGKGNLAGEKEYVVVSQVFLLRSDAALDKFFSRVESIPAELYFARTSIVKLIHAIELIDYSKCINESLFLMPSGRKEGYTREELEGEGWEYLKKL